MRRPAVDFALSADVDVNDEAKMSSAAGGRARAAARDTFWYMTSRREMLAYRG